MATGISEWRPGMPLNMGQCPGRPPPPRAFCFPPKSRQEARFGFSVSSSHSGGGGPAACSAPHPTGCSPVRLLRRAGGPTVAASLAVIKSGS